MNKILFYLIFIIWFISHTTFAATITVTNDADSGVGSLRDAITTIANDGDTIQFAGNYNIKLSTQLNINKNITIDGSGYNLTVSGEGNSRVFHITNTTTATLKNLTISNGYDPGNAGGIVNDGSLTIDNCTITNNVANGNGSGIGNFLNGFLTINNSTIINNNNNNDGGGIYVDSGMVIISQSTISDNSANKGGGIYVQSGILTINDSTLSHNTAQQDGGILYNENGTQVTINNSTLAESSAQQNGGALYGAVTVNNSTLSKNSATLGGGIYIENNSHVDIVNSTFLANQAIQNGGAIYNNHSQLLTIDNSTFSANLAVEKGGALFNNSRTIINYNTFSLNKASDGGGIYNEGTIELNNTIIANSVTGGDCRNNDTIAPNMNNLIQDNSCDAVLGGDPNLGELANHGGATETYALLSNSIAIDAGDKPCLKPTDQRGQPRGAVCDIGAFELNRPPIAGFGGALEFDGTNDYIDLQPHINQIANSNKGTIAGWFKTSSPDPQTIFSLSESTTNDNLMFIMIGESTSDVDDESFTFQIKRDGTIELAMLITKGNNYYTNDRWHHFAVVTGEGDNRIYIDGISQPITYQTGDSTTDEFSALPSSDRMRIGNLNRNGDQDESHFEGQLDEISIWNKALPETDIQKFMNPTFLSGNENGLLGYWRFEEGHGVISHDKTGMLSGMLTNMEDNDWVGTSTQLVTRINQPLNGHLTAIDLDGDNLTYSIVTHSSLGNVALTDPSTGAFTYTPNRDQGGIDNFTYQVNDGSGDSNQVTVIVRIINGVVDLLDDPNDGQDDSDFSIEDNTLREAITYAQPGDTITFASALADQTIKLDSPLTIDKDLTIDGAQHHITISGGDNNRLFEIISGKVTLNNLTLSDGKSEEGGAIRVGTNAHLVLNNCTISYNKTIANPKQGGGLFIKSGAQVEINNCLIKENLSNGGHGGGIFNQGDLALNNTTFSQNQANKGGGGLYNDNSASVTINNSTFAENSASINQSGSGIYNGGDLILKNTIVANNEPQGGDCHNAGNINEHRNNLIGDGSCDSDKSGDPMLANLADNGGDTETYALLANSPAIDAGNHATCIATDQRGESRSIDGNGDGTKICDIGAFEVQDSVPVVMSTIPEQNATGVTSNPSITILFSESVNVTANSFSLECPDGHFIPVSVSTSQNTEFTLTPQISLPLATQCQVKVKANQISDLDSVDPPDSLVEDYSLSFQTVAQTLPLSPTNLKATIVSAEQIKLSWVDNSHNETGFKIQRDGHELVTTAAEITTYHDDDLTCGNNYTYSVTAINAAGESPATTVNANTWGCPVVSNKSSTTISDSEQKNTPPATQSATANEFNVVASSPNEVVLTWNDTSDTGFKIERDGVVIHITAAHVNTYKDTDLTCNTTYNYQVKAIHDSGDLIVLTASVTTPDCTPTVPTNLQVTPISPTEIHLTWTDNSNNEKGFRIERNGRLIHITLANVTSYQDTGLNCGTTYDYQIKAMNTTSDSTVLTKTVTTLPCATNTSPMNLKLSLSFQGNGQGQISSNQNNNQINLACEKGIDHCIYYFNAPQSVSLIATAAEGSQFSHWKGDCQGTAHATEIILDRDQDCIAHFHKIIKVPAYQSIPAAKTTLDFGSSEIGKTITLPLQIFGTGNTTLEITKMEITGSHAQNFNLTPGTIPFTLFNSSSPHILKVHCLPSEIGVHQARLTLETNDPNCSNIYYDLSCTGLSPYHAPVDITLSNQTVDEDSPSDTFIGKLTTLDPDANEVHHYTLLDDAEHFFTLQGDELHLSEQAQLDFATTPTYTIQVRSTDNSGLFFDKTFTIYINKVHETRFLGKIRTASWQVGKNVTIDAPEQVTVMGYIRPQLTHIGQHADVIMTYHWTSYQDAQTLTVPVTIARQIPLSSAMEMTLYKGRLIGLTGVFKMSLGYQLNNGEHYSGQIVTLTVSPNRSPTDLVLSKNTVLEDSSPNTVIGHFAALDLDQQDQFIYGFVDNPGDYFKIVGDELRVNNFSLDYESGAAYPIKVRGVDLSGDYIEKNFTIYVTDTASQLKDIQLTQTSVFENSPNGLIVARLLSQDDEPSQYKYELLHDAQGRFTLMNDLLLVAQEERLDFETQPFHPIVVRSRKSGTEQILEKFFTINLLNVVDVNIKGKVYDINQHLIDSTRLRSAEEVTINMQLFPDQTHQGQLAELLTVAIWKPKIGQAIAYMLAGDTWVKWDGDFATLSCIQYHILQKHHELKLWQGKLPDLNQGQFHIFGGYRLKSGKVIYSPKSFDIQLQ